MALVVRSDIPQHLTAGLQTIYRKAYLDTPTIWQQIAFQVNSKKNQETYAWLGNVPGMNELIDERQVKALAERGAFTIVNNEYEATIGVRTTALKDDQYGAVAERVRGLGAVAKLHIDQLVVELLKNGFAATCYDGQYFFDTDHSEGASGTQSNKGTTALGAASLKAGITAMRKFKDDQGRVMGVNPTHLVVPPDLEWTASELLKAATLWATGSTDATGMNINILQGRLKLLVSPYLTDADDWFLLDCSRMKPLILQMREQPTFEALDKNTESEFMKKVVYYGVYGRYNAGYGMWQFAYGASV